MNLTNPMRTPAKRSIRRPLLLALSALFYSAVAYADCDPQIDAACAAQSQAAPTSIVAMQTPLAALQSHLRKRDIDPNQLTLAAMVDVMFEWYRLEPLAARAEDQLLFRYGGWSEGCVTGFKFSVLRRVAGGADSGERLAGLTMLFDPSGKDELAPHSSASAEASSLEAFAAQIKGSRAYQKLNGVTPMGVMMETGGMR